MVRKSNPNRGAKKGERRGGRAPGTPNKITAELKDMIRGALDDAGGREYLKRQAIAEPVAFMTLLGKILPKEVTGLGGKDLVPGGLPGAIQMLTETQLLAIATGKAATEK